MKAINKALKRVALTSSLVLLQACATSPLEPMVSTPTPQELMTISDIQHRIKPHERLGDIAIQYTGSAANWDNIANYNGISNPRHLRIGAIITIPGSLLSPGLQQNLAATGTQNELQQVAAARPNTTTLASNTLAVKRTLSRRASDAVLEPVKTNKTFKLNPIKKSKLIAQAHSQAPLAQVKIVGTYYPKGIYQQPANYSALVMRAAPGTLFELEYLANDWYKIITPNGIGYLREDDGKVVSMKTES